MTRVERMLLTATLALALLTMTLLPRLWLGRQYGGALAASGTYYGANDTLVAAAAADWPQANSNWCGIATIELVANYTYELAGGQGYFPFHTGGQQQIVN